MAEQRFLPPRGAQDTGNPVLDSLVNLLSSRATSLTPEALRDLHKVLLELAEQEPRGLTARV